MIIIIWQCIYIFFLTCSSLEKNISKKALLKKCNFCLHILAMFPHGNKAFFRNLHTLWTWDLGYFSIGLKWLKPPNVSFIAHWFLAVPVKRLRTPWLSFLFWPCKVNSWILLVLITTQPLFNHEHWPNIKKTHGKQ